MKTINAYTLNELSEAVQDKVIRKFRDINVDHDWYDCAIYEWTEKLSTLGFLDAEISFSGFSSQGDGCAFKATLDLDKFLHGKFVPLQREDLECRFEPYLGWTSHRRWTFTQENYLSNSEMDELSGEFVDYINEYKDDLAHEIYRALEREYDYLQSDESVRETIEANDYHFLEDGTQI